MSEHLVNLLIALAALFVLASWRLAALVGHRDHMRNEERWAQLTVGAVVRSPASASTESQDSWAEVHVDA